MANKKKQQKLILSKEAEGSLTAAEILHREAEYRNGLGSFKKGLIEDEKFKYKGIQKLAKDLEAAGTVETNRISIRIKSDLKTIIIDGLLSREYVDKVLESKYKQAPHNPKGPKVKENSFQDAEQSDKERSNESQEATGSAVNRLEPDEYTPSKSPISVKEELDHDESIDDQYHFIRGLTELITGLKEEKLLNSNDNFKLVEETKQYRLGVVKRLDDLNLKTIYGNVRTLALVLNDYVKQLDNEVGVRQSKGELLQE